MAINKDSETLMLILTVLLKKHVKGEKFCCISYIMKGMNRFTNRH